MNQNTKERRRIENYLGYIKNILINREVECDDSWWNDADVVKKITELLNVEQYEICTSQDLKINCDEVFIFIACKKVENNIKFVELIKEKINTISLETLDKSLAVNIICIVNNMKSRIYLEKLLEPYVSTELKRIIKKRAGNKSKRLNLTYVLDSDYEIQDIKLRNINRFDFIQMPPISNHINLEKEDDETTDAEGYVMSIDLYQLVEIYNLLGDSLFKRNVRYGLNEQLGVDKAIKETLHKKPEKFWFRNNGITLLIEKNDFKLDRVGEILLDKVEKYVDLSFSIVNGAQTITAAAEYFYSLEYEKEKSETESKRLEVEKIINESKKAKVLLRILHIRKSEKGEGDNELSSNEVNEISVALNRQKPIKIEDIAFTSFFVEQLIVYLEEKSSKGVEYFKLVKRGESNIYNNGIDLIEFARARKACARKPGEARSKSANAMLGADNKYGDEFKFSDTEVFVEEWIENDENRDRVFNKYFKAIIFANKLAQSYEKDIKNIEDDNKMVNNIIMNGKWYFVSYMISLLNDFRVDESSFPDYTKFDTTIDINKLNIKSLVIKFAQNIADLVQKSEEAEFSEIDSNMFKKDNLFNLIYRELNPEEFINIINGNSDKKMKINNKPILDKKARAKAIKVSKIVIHKKVKAVKNPTEAIVNTYSTVLQDNQDIVDEFINKYPRILTYDKDRKDGFFRNSKPLFKMNNKMLYIGTSSSFADKVLFIGHLSDFVGFEKGSIIWMDEEECVYSN